MIKHIQWGFVRVLFWTILIFAISISGLRYALSELDFFKTDIEALLSKHLGAPVTIANIQGVLNGLKPELSLQNIAVHSEQNNATPVHLQEIHLGFSMLAAIQQSFLEAIQISIIGADLSVTRMESGAINIKGLPNTDDNKQPTWLMRGKQYKLINSEILWHDEKRNAAPVQFKQINITLNNDAGQHKIFISTDLPESLGKSLHMVIDFSGDFFVPESINARLFVQGLGIHFDKFITGDLPFDFAFTQGSGNFSIWSKWQAAQMTQMRGSINLVHAEIKDNNNAQFPIDLLDLNFILQKHQQQWRLGIKDSVLKSKNINLALAQLALAIEFNTEDDVTHLAINSPLLPLEPISKIILLNKLLPDNLLQQLKTIALEGEVKDLLLISNPSQETFAVNAQLSGIKTRPMENIPGINNLEAYIKGSEQQGLIQISSSRLNFAAPNLFRNPFDFNHALGELHWQHSDAWVISSPLVELNTEHFKTSTKFVLTLPQQDEPTLSMQSSFDILDASHTPQYLPSGILDPEVVDWLDHAFVKGTAKQGGVILRGALADYPFAQHKGVFEILFAAKDVELHYTPDWQDIQNVAAQVRFFSDSMNIDIHQGRANDSTIQNATVSIDSFGKSQYIDIQGNIKSSLSDTVLYLTHSPFKDQVTAINDVVDIQGSTDIHVDLKIPLANQALKANIKAKTKDASAIITPIDLAISDITADFLFTENGVFSKHISAISLGFPLTAEISSNNQAISTKVSGRTSIKQLAKQFPNPAWAYASGSSDYHTQIEFPKNSEQICTIQLNSDLVGTAIHFSPLSKPKAQIHSLSIKLGIAPSGLDTFNIAYENPLKLQNRVNIKLKKIPPHWQGIIHSPIASGSVFIPLEFNNKSDISLSLKELDLSALQEIDMKSDGASLIVKNLPSIKLNSEELYWNNTNLGRLKLQTQPTDQGLAIKQFDLSSLNNSLSLSGFWQQHNQQNSSSISGQFLSQDFGTFLTRTKLFNDIVDTTAELNFVLNWPAAPYEVSKSILSGTVDTQLSNGRILGVNPGLGRVLGALDIWKLGKRLSFDFSDITESGLSFSESTGHFAIDQGSVKTKDLIINAMPAKIYISGSTNLASEQIDLLATVLPKFPIAGTIIGNVANAVSKTFIGNEQPGGLIVSLLYQIKGTWEHFTINRQFSSVLNDDPTTTP
ncbi:hypothetical protein AU255_04130 [Methyloprofundus sedimenti]|uniref:YhdP central domain-containing protein n=1 Tax=Methyloprofundus sedimenti TaxID=1420851 RepID=A0A1V8M6A7_9GAMM|nr:DUF3971 domain-containing protein [Methyloprofundus sedimenti]OQK17095.1 hypothetical protein AU255_04130 [Methyloprofundus sedimenti]